MARLTYRKRINAYIQQTAIFFIFADIIIYTAVLSSIFHIWPLIETWILTGEYYLMTKKVILNPNYKNALWLYKIISTLAVTSVLAYCLIIPRNIIKKLIERTIDPSKNLQNIAKSTQLPPWPFNKESFSIVLGELQDRDGSRLPNENNPTGKPKWLIQNLTAMVTGYLITGGIGSGKTAAFAKPVLDQLIQHERMVKVKQKKPDGTIKIVEEPYRWSGLVTDEKGDFCMELKEICKKYGRLKDVIELTPEGYWKWNAIFNPGMKPHAVAFALGKLLHRFNKGQQGNDPFWIQAPKEILLDLITLMNDCQDYYGISDFLNLIIDTDQQKTDSEFALEKFDGTDYHKEVLQRHKRLMNRISTAKDAQGGTSQTYMSLVACAKAGLAHFQFPEIRDTFSPSAEDYFTDPCCPWPRRIPDNATEKTQFDFEHERGLRVPKPNVFTNFDTHLDYGTLVALNMPKTQHQDSAILIQIMLKANWQTSVMRRDVKNLDGSLLIPKRFGKDIGYCPTFIMADECQESVDPEDQNFMAQCRSKLACCMWLTQSHDSIIAAMGQGKKKDADTFFSNTMTHIYFRQSNLESMQIIEKEVGTKLVIKTGLSTSEGGQNSELKFLAGDIVHESIGVSETVNTSVEEKPFFKIEQMSTLQNFTAIVLPSNGDSRMESTICYMQPLFLFEQEGVKRGTPHDEWPEKFRTCNDLEHIPQNTEWKGWKSADPVTTAARSHSGFISEALIGESYADKIQARDDAIRQLIPLYKQTEILTVLAKLRQDAATPEQLYLHSAPSEEERSREAEEIMASASAFFGKGS